MSVYRKGVNVKEGTGVSPLEGLSQTVTGIMGTFERGPTNVATIVNTLAEFQRIFGTKAPTLGTSKYEVEAFFAAVGTAPLAIVNIKGPSAAKSTKTIQDKDGTPENTLKIDALAVGDWGDYLSIQIVDDSILTTTLVEDTGATPTSAKLTSTTGLEIGSFLNFDDGVNSESVVLTSVEPTTGVVQWSGALTNAYAVATPTVVSSLEFQLIVYENGVEVENWPNLSMKDEVTFFCETVINGNSNYIVVTDLDSASAAEYDTLPAVTAITALTGGDDDLTSIEATHWTGVEASGTGVYAFNAVDNIFRIAAPNPILNTTPETAILTVVQALLSFANAKEDVQVYAEPLVNKTAAEAITFRNNFEGRRLSIWYPWILLSDGSATITPTGAVLGAGASKDYRRGLFKSIGNESLGVSGTLERVIGVIEDNTLNEAEVNTIRSYQGLSTWGGRTCSAVTRHRFINHSELFNWISTTFKAELVDVTFEPNTAATRASLLRRLTAFFDRLVHDEAVTAYSIVCDDSNNPGDQIALGRLYCDIEYVPAGVAEKIIFTLTSSPAGLSISS